MTARKSRRKTADPASKGLTPEEAAGGEPPAEVSSLEERIRAAGGSVLSVYREPWGGHWLALAALPVASVEPTPFQRDLSDTHAKKLEDVIAKVGLFLDPLVAVPAPDGDGFWTPNGLHRLAALKRLGARAVTALVSPESAYTLELEEPHLITLGFAYEGRPRFAGGAYAPALKPSDAFLDAPLAETLLGRATRAERLLAIDDRVTEIIGELKEKGFDSPYLRNFVTARIRPFRPRGKPAPEPDALLDYMAEKAAKFDTGKIKADQVAKAAGSAD
jgi:ParB family chromosome partitioning protein